MEIGLLVNNVFVLTVPLNASTMMVPIDQVLGLYTRSFQAWNSVSENSKALDRTGELITPAQAQHLAPKQVVYAPTFILHIVHFH